jgi:hypothetical protein
VFFTTPTTTTDHRHHHHHSSFDDVTDTSPLEERAARAATAAPTTAASPLQHDAAAAAAVPVHASTPALGDPDKKLGRWQLLERRGSGATSTVLLGVFSHLSTCSVLLLLRCQHERDHCNVKCILSTAADIYVHASPHMSRRGPHNT